MVGSLNWLVTLGHHDIHYTVCTLAGHMMMPGQGHLYAMRNFFGYLKQNYKFSINCDIKEPDFSMRKIEDYYWFPFSMAIQKKKSHMYTHPLVFQEIKLCGDKHL
eukprot:6833143-Ditylum_brightwellii.AAC.1